MPKHDLSVIVVSYNTSKLTVQAIESVLATGDAEILVVDNNSSDDSIPLLQKKFGSKITLIENKENVGFARANNQGVKEARGTYVMLLNSDTIVHPGSLDALLHTLQHNTDIGIVAARLQNSDGSYQPQGGALPTLVNIATWWLWPLPGVFPGVLPYQNPKGPKGNELMKRGWVGGTAMMLRRDAYLSLGGLDEGIFMYAEDIDLCMRVHDTGLGVAIDPRAIVTHLGSASGSSLRAKVGEVKGLLYIFKKNRSTLSVLLLRHILIKGSLLRYLLFGILRGSSNARKLYWSILTASVQ